MNAAPKPVSKTQTALGLVLLFVTVWCLIVLVILAWQALALATARDLGASAISGFVFQSFPLVPASLTALVWWAGVRRPIWGGAGVLLLAPLFVYLAVDDAAVNDPLTVQELGEPFPEAEASQAVLLRYAKGTPAAEAFRLPEGLPEKFPKPSSPEWEALVNGKSERVASAWAEIEPLRSWWAEWSDLPRIGDLTDRLESPIPNFKPMRGYADLACAEAGRLALAGKGDAALAVLAPVLVGARKLIPYSRTSVRTMIAIYLQLRALETAEFVLKRTTVSPEARTRLATILTPAGEGAAGARRIIAREYATLALIISRLEAQQAEAGWHGSFLGGPVRDGFMDWVLMNPTRTLNRYQAVMSEAQELAARRDAAGVTQRITRFAADGAGRQGLKNVYGGSLAADFATMDFTKIIKNYWEVEDRRAAVLATLRGETHPTLSTQNREDKK